MEKRTTLTNGLRWLRHPLAVIIILVIPEAFQKSANQQIIIVSLLIAAIVWIILYMSQRIRFDSGNFFITNGQRERVIPFAQIDSVKRSGRKYNNRKYWYIEYSDKDDQPKKKYFLEGNFQHNSVKELIEAIKEVKPNLLVWTHPHFNKPDPEEDLEAEA